MRRGGSVPGAVSLVMIFCVLCLAVFATLTYVTADRERQLAELTAQRAAGVLRRRRGGDAKDIIRAV